MAGPHRSGQAVVPAPWRAYIYLVVRAYAPTVRRPVPMPGYLCEHMWMYSEHIPLMYMTHACAFTPTVSNLYAYNSRQNAWGTSLHRQDWSQKGIERHPAGSRSPHSSRCGAGHQLCGSLPRELGRSVKTKFKA